MKIKVIIEKHRDGYVAYPLGMRGIVAEGESFEEVFANIKSAIRFHLETFPDINVSQDIREAFVAEVTIEEQGKAKKQ